MSVVEDHQDEGEPRIVRILGDSTSRDSQVRVPPDTTVLTTADGDVEVIPILPGSAYDRGPSVPLDA